MSLSLSPISHLSTAAAIFNISTPIQLAGGTHGNESRQDSKRRGD